MSGSGSTATGRRVCPSRSNKLIPAPLTFAVLALAAYRTYRLASHDTAPPLPTLRARFVGAHLTAPPDRPRLAEWLACSYCSGAWWSLAWYAAWLAWPHGTLYAAVPFALSAAVAIIQTALPE